MRRVQRAARRPEARSSAIVAGTALGPRAPLPPELGQPGPTRRPPPRGETPRAALPPPPAPPVGRFQAPGLAQVAARPPHRGHCSPRASYLHGAGDAGSHSRPPGSAAPAPAAEGAAAPGARAEGRSAINTRGRRRRRRERAIRAGGGRPRSEPSKVAWGGGEGGAGRVGGERAQGRHGLLDAGPNATRAGKSGTKRAVAASPPRAAAERPQPCARAGPAASEAGEREVKAVAPLPGPGPAPRRGKQGRRAARAAGTAGEPQPPPAFSRRPARPHAPPRSALGAGAPRGGPPGAPLPDPDAHTSDLRLTWSGGRSRLSALRHRTERCATRDTPVLLLGLEMI